MPPKKAQTKTKDASDQPPKKKLKLDPENAPDVSSSSTLSGPPSTSLELSARSSKVDKIDAKPKCLVIKLPNELIANIVSGAGHPFDVLSLSLTCKTMHAVLTDPSANFMWKHARENFMMITVATSIQMDPQFSPFPLPTTKGRLPFQKKEPTWSSMPVPSPLTSEHITPAPTEAQFAQFLFGLRPCQNCKKKTNRPPFSVNLNIILCSKCSQSSWTSLCIHIDVARTEFGELKARSTSFIKLWGSLPHLERDVQDYSYSSALYGHRYAKRSDWARTMEECLQAKESGAENLESFLKKISSRGEKMSLRYEKAGHLLSWVKSYENHCQILETQVDDMAELFARSKGLNLNDMKKAPNYRAVRSNANKARTLDVVPFFKEKEDAIASETYLIQDNRVRRSLEESKKKRLAAILTEYHSYDFPNGIKPTFETFRSIPVIRALHKTVTASIGVDMQTGRTLKQSYDELYSGYDGSSGGLQDDSIQVRAMLKESRVKPLLLAGIAQWRDGAIAGARNLLGYAKPATRVKTQEEPKAKSKSKSKGKGKGKADPKSQETVVANEEVRAANTSTSRVELKEWRSDPHKVDPELRISSWFVCTKCKQLDPTYKRLRVLDFKGMCAHQCIQPGKKKEDVTSWHMSNFAPAPRAIATTKAMLQILGKNEEDPSTRKTDLIGDWVCNDCPSGMKAMEWEDLIRHCNRHETPNIAKCTEQQARRRDNFPDMTLRQHSFAYLLMKSHERDARKKQIVCVHCQSKWTDSDAADMEMMEAVEITKGQANVDVDAKETSENVNATAIVEENSKKKRSKKPRPMDIHAIRQHMKARHGILDVRNEDFYFIDAGDVEMNIADSSTEKKTDAEGKGKGTATQEDLATLQSGRFRSEEREMCGYDYKCWLCRPFTRRRMGEQGLRDHLLAKHEGYVLTQYEPEFIRQKGPADISGIIELQNAEDAAADFITSIMDST